MPFVRLSLLALVALLPLPAQRLVPVDNPQTRVVAVTDPPNRKGRMHEHSMNRVMIYLDRGIQRISWQDGRIDDLKVQPGEVLWSAAGGMHTSENVGGVPYRIVEVELRSAGRPVEFPPLDPRRVAPASYSVVLENQQVRVLKLRLAGRGRVPEHEHVLGRVVVTLTPLHIRVTAPDGSTAEERAEAGQAQWADPGRRALENLSPEPLELLLVELK